MSNTWKLSIENQFAFLEFDQPDSKVNVLSSATLKELAEIIAPLKERKDLKGLCLLSKKSEVFIAGADIKEIEKITLVEEGKALVRAGQKIINDFEGLPFPTIALINGACLGGGLELALACDYRLAAFGDKVKLGLPEVKLGVIPAFGGTKRLPRLVGLRKGVELITSGNTLNPREALKIGLVDGLVSTHLLGKEGIEFLSKKRSKRKKFTPPVKGLVNLFFEKNFLGRLIFYNIAKKSILKTTKGQYPAPLQALEVVLKNYPASLEKALEREAKIFASLVISEISKNLVFLFFLQDKFKKEKWIEAKPLEIRKCGILGAGVMGGGIAQLFSFYNLPVRMKDLNYQALGKGLKQAREVYDYALKRKRVKPHQVVYGMGLISATLDFLGFSNADLIVEAVVEDLKIKQKVFEEISSIAKPTAILATNTSCLSIEKIGAKVKDPSRVVGMHFFNPVHRMPLIEVVRSPFTGDETVVTIVELAKKMEKVPIVVKDSCGFLVNRVLIPYLVEAGYLLEEGVDFAKIDQIMLQFGLPMGPFTLMDEIGLDVGYKVALLIEEHFGERMKVSSILKKVYEKKWLGKKVGRGFYQYKGKDRLPNQEIYSLLSKRKDSFSAEEILSRMLYRMINEAALCLEEEICRTAEEVDIGMVMGIGFPPFRGGLLRYADTLGCDKIVAGLSRFRDQLSSTRFVPSFYLQELAKRRKKFYGNSR